MAQGGKALATQPGDLSWLLRTNIKVERETPQLSSDPHPAPHVLWYICVCIYTRDVHTLSVYKKENGILRISSFSL